MALSPCLSLHTIGAMGNPKDIVFGTDGVRDLAGQGGLTLDNVRLLGQVMGARLQEQGQGLSVVVGRDPRPSGPEIFTAITEGLMAHGVSVLDLGVVPTPVVAHVAAQRDAALGVVISASHNPAEYNGIKLFDGRGEKISAHEERTLEELSVKGVPPAQGKTGTLERLDHAAEAFVHEVASRTKVDLRDVHIAIDCANGATAVAAKALFEKMGATLSTMGMDQSGHNINELCGATVPEALQKKVREVGADVGFSFDGDGDRCICIDGAGAIRDGDYMLAIGGRYLKKQGQLNGDVVVSTSMANLGLEKSFQAAGIQLLRTDVGDKYITREMLAHQYDLGGEQSGHVIYRKNAPTGDGLCTALEMVKTMLHEEKSLEELSGCMDKYPQILINIMVKSKPAFETLPKVMDHAKAIEDQMADTGRLVLRYSGTEPKARVMIEGADQAQIESLAQALAETIKQEIGAD